MLLLACASRRSVVVESFVPRFVAQPKTWSTTQQQQQPERQRTMFVPCPATTTTLPLTSLCVARYGPPPSSETSSFSNNKNRKDNDDDDTNDLSKSVDVEFTKEDAIDNDDDDGESMETRQQKMQFRTLLNTCLATTQEDHLPKLLSQHIELIMSLHGQDGAHVLADLCHEAEQEGEVAYTRTVEMTEYILEFYQEFVEQAHSLDAHNKKLLGKIIRAMTGTVEGQMTEGTTPLDAPPSAREKEDVLDRVLLEEKEYFTPGFLRHLEGECHRIVSAPQLTPASARLLEILRMIQTRVLEELGQDMGEAAIVLGQLMGYDNDNELVAVLEAGLTVRGTDFAEELKALTVEALEGFQRVPRGMGGVEEELVERVTLVDQRLASYLEEQNNKWQ
jgi:hypothetical protein